MLRFSGAGASDVGAVRAHNEDAGYVGPYLALVADGVGGAAAGEVASAAAAYVVSGGVRRRPQEDPVGLLQSLIAEASRRVDAEAAADERRAGMATTLTAVATDGHRVALGHIGDSRAYLFRDHRLVRVSHDHTYVQRLIDDGLLTPDGARRHPWRHVVSRSLPVRDPADGPDVGELDLAPGDRLVLCTDGLTDAVSESRIAEVLGLPETGDAAGRLVGDALVAGAPDNVTCLVVDVVEGAEVVADGTSLGSLAGYAGLSAPASGWSARH